MSFLYSKESCTQIAKYITDERLTAYMVAARGSLRQAIALYERNCQLSQSLYGVIQTYEILLRNTIHSTLGAGLSNTDWFSIPNLLKYREAQKIGEAKTNLQRWKKRVLPGGVVAALTFGFWVRLHAAEYEKSLWVPHLYKAYPHLSKPDRKAVFDRLDGICRLRNRVAHHEHIFSRPLHLDYAAINTAASWVCPTTAAWMDSTNTLMPLLRRLGMV